MIDIMIQPRELKEAKREIKDIIRNYNYRNQWSMIELRDSDGRFMPEHYWLNVIDNLDQPDGEFFIRLEFDDDHKVARDMESHFGERNVGYI